MENVKNGKGDKWRKAFDFKKYFEEFDRIFKTKQNQTKKGKKHAKQ